ncbi:MAG: Hpt domain-containing protein [Pseudomonadota bacterium]
MKPDLCVAQSNDSDDDLVGYYLDWTNEAVSELSGLIAQVGDSADAELQQKIYEICHNIKGMGTSFGFPLMTEAGSTICTYLRRLDNAPMDQGLLAAHLKSFQLILAKRMAGDGGQVGRELIDRLTQLVEHMLAE